MVGAYALPQVVHEVQVSRIYFGCYPDPADILCDSYIVAAALDGGTQVISFMLNFVSDINADLSRLRSFVVQAVFGASGTPHSFPSWWGNG